MMWKPFDNLPPSGNKPFTDLSRWRLLVNDGGRETWHYLKTDEEIAKWPQTELDKYWLGLDMGLPELPPAKNAFEAARNGYKFYKYLQSEEGPWTGECGGAIFLLPCLVIGSYMADMPFKDEGRLEMIRFLMNTSNPDDGGWRFHNEGPSTLFGTGMSYVTLRILGLSKDHPVCVKARKTIHAMGGAISIPTWGKFFLAMLNCYDWEGNNSIPPELWLLPDWSPCHPHRWWIHCRSSYLPMSYIYGVRLKMEENDLILSLRQELFLEDYYSINWPAQRNNINGPDIYAPHTKLYDILSSVTYLYEQCPVPPLRRAGVARAYELVVLDDENTGYETADSVAKMLNLVVRVHAEGRDSRSYEQHRLKRPDYMWMESRGMMMSGTNGTQLWDTAFVMQGVVGIGLGEHEENKESLVRALTWMEGAQMTKNPMHYHTAYRHATKGAWGFSTREQGYTVSDCTAEGLKAVLLLQDLDYTPKLVSKERMCDAVDIMLSLQNSNGGFGSYEPARAPHWVEWLNPSEIFGKVMLDYCSPECTTSVITALAMFKKHFPDYRARDIDRTTKNAIKYIHQSQRPDGSWVGTWGVCFTYAMHFALEGLSLVGETYENSIHARKACEYLLRKQRKDGGWGESFKSCEQGIWVEHKDTQVVQTSWAVMSLMFAKYPYPEPIERGVQLVMSRQRPDGSWAQEAVEGVANQTIPMNYPNFKFAFTIWMLGNAHRYLAKLRRGGEY